jgi:hypothetical protein
MRFQLHLFGRQERALTQDNFFTQDSLDSFRIVLLGCIAF